VTVAWPAPAAPGDSGAALARLTFSAPPGGAVSAAIAAGAALTLRVEAPDGVGGTVAAEARAQELPGFGLTIVRLSAEDWTAAELEDLEAALDRVSGIYEAAGVTLRLVHHESVPRAGTGELDVIDAGKACACVRDHPGTDPSCVDVVLSLAAAGKEDGLACLNEDGCWASRCGHETPAGPRLHVPYLGMLIAHEVGHILLGTVEHSTEPFNLLRDGSHAADTELDDGQMGLLRAPRHRWVQWPRPVLPVLLSVAPPPPRKSVLVSRRRWPALAQRQRLEAALAVRQPAVAAIARLVDPSAVPVLAQIGADEWTPGTEPAPWAAAVAVLALLAEPPRPAGESARQALLGLAAGGPDVSVRGHALGALCGLADVRVLPTLLAHLADSTSRVASRLARRALQSFAAAVGVAELGGLLRPLVDPANAKWLEALLLSLQQVEATSS